MTKKIPKSANKHSELRRKRPLNNVATHKETYIEVKTKSRAGVEYINYKPVLTHL